ncbi:uncharacterized protein LOC133726973 [Rosa rugosa]|uniref:uncharacterized protein LOC133726973 n=1 Tax=Rosa rugosa TaxID=74645 RepID=UPI002B4032A6|nr:uncharacterized protein LOC133726973 [Rosa rugosa]
MNTPFHDHEKKPKKSFMSSYKPSPGRHLKPDSKPDMVDKYPVLRSWFSLSRKSKTRQEVLDQFEHAQSQREEPDKQVGVVVESARKSVSHVESNLVSVASFLQVKVLVSDMPGFMQVHAFRSARRTYDSLEKFSPKHMAYNLKKEFDKMYGPAWHCIVGSGFGSFVTHSTGCFLYFSMEKLCILLFRTKIQKAEV